ncbi:hypothetical protein [Mesobacillus foraminis]|uniref:Uncharacterized protein n=1 Tax=Mesobacillus foraminis TaxID=279826 RepID=A0A4R2BIA3_9BACI|nr:hypothetical protein [Mesobacillus foraminis]TCN26801.1 hypothetical protein EV146_103324 [Mesobacillus foraminis]
MEKVFMQGMKAKPGKLCEKGLHIGDEGQTEEETLWKRSSQWMKAKPMKKLCEKGFIQGMKVKPMKKLYGKGLLTGDEDQTEEETLWKRSSYRG